MRDTKKRAENFSFFDHSGIVKHLTKMARRGWMLERMGRLTWTYRKIPPADVRFADVRFAVTYFPGASDKKDADDRVVDYLTYCAEAGWKLCGKNGQMLVFYAEREDAVPIETDVQVQLDTIHRTMLKTYLPELLLFIVLGIIIMFLPPREPAADAAGNFAYGGILRAAVGFLTIVFAVIEAACYLRWYKKARRAVLYDGVLPEAGRASGIARVIFVLDLVCFIGYVILNGSPSALAAMAVVYGIRILRE